MASNNTENQPLQGEIWLFDPDPIKGNEIGKKVRPVVIISNDHWNKIRSGLVIIVPLTSVNKGISTHIQIDPPEGGVSISSFAMCEQIRSISRERLIKKLGKISSKALLKKIRSWILDLTNID